MDEEKNPRFEVTEQGEARTVYLSGQWNLFSKAGQQRRIAAEINRLETSRELKWDLTGVETMDSAGALLLWHAWGKRLPESFNCRPNQRQWFDRLAGLEIDKKLSHRSVWTPLLLLGRRLERFLGDLGNIMVLIGRVLLDIGYLLRHPRYIPWVEISASIYRTGASGLMLLGVIGVLIGIVMTYQLAMTLTRFGANTMIIGLLGLSILRELGPMITALIVIGRNGSATTAGIGAMHITEEYDALRAFGMSPTRRLVTPRVIGMAISVPLLTIWTDFTALLGGIVTSDLRLNVNYNVFIQRFPEAVQWINLWIGLGKGVLFGLVIAVVSSHFGLKIRASTQSLSQETTNSVVASLALILLIDSTLGALLVNVGLV